MNALQYIINFFKLRRKFYKITITVCGKLFFTVTAGILFNMVGYLFRNHIMMAKNGAVHFWEKAGVMVWLFHFDRFKHLKLVKNI